MRDLRLAIVLPFLGSLNLLGCVAPTPPGPEEEDEAIATESQALSCDYSWWESDVHTWTQCYTYKTCTYVNYYAQSASCTMTTCDTYSATYAYQYHTTDCCATREIIDAYTASPATIVSTSGGTNCPLDDIYFANTANCK